MNPNSSLVSGFDSSTENQADFKRSKVKNRVAPFLVKFDPVPSSPCFLDAELSQSVRHT
jgi:hypothetical protein